MKALEGIDCYVWNCMTVFEYGVVIIICKRLVKYIELGISEI